ncbi:hypothetical protein CVT24_006423, partial [Panaeolus cyanescens]
MEDNLPVYSNKAPPSQMLPAGGLPQYAPPSQFTIGAKRTTASLVAIPEIKGHLALLNAFYELKLNVESPSFPSGGRIPTDKNRRWGWFVGLAVERFDTWCQNLEYGVDYLNNWSTVMPPIDVLMVWHAYMLNPKWYGEDGMRGTLRALKQLDKHFSTALTTDLHEFLRESPSPQRVAFWERKSNTTFDHVYGVQCLVAKEIKCPLCLTPLTVDYMDPYKQGKGYLQHAFVTPCLNYCGIEDITKEKLAVRKLANDLAAPLSTPQLFLAGTNFQPNSINDQLFSNTAQARVLAAAGVTTPTTIATQEAAAVSIMMFSEFTMEKLRATMNVLGPDRLTGRIMSAYNDDKPYSLDLVGAVLRQSSFIQKMYDLGWTRQGFFDGFDNEIVLHHAIARYHGFLDLLSSSPASFFVPTLDIDLVWHTHQLCPARYTHDTVHYVGRYIDHDDKVEGLRLSSSFDITCKAWKDRFGIPYTHCGCPHPGQKAEDLDDPHSFGKRISRIFGSSSKTEVTANGSSGFQQSEKPVKNLLIPSTERADAMSATHPSDHNAVRFANKGIITARGLDLGKYRHERMSKKYDSLLKQRRKRAEKLEKKRASLNKKAAKAAGAGGSGLDVGGLPKAPHAPGNTSSTRDRNGAAYSPYDAVFLAPIPLFYGPGMMYGGPIGGCAAYYGGYVATPVSGCGNCGSGGTCGGGCGGGGLDNLASGN